MINKLELGWGKSWPNGKCKTRFVEFVRHAGAVQIMFGLHSTLGCICCQIMFGLQSTLDYICCQIIISGKTFLMLKNENLCINGRKWCFDIIWLYSASHVYIRRPTFGTSNLHSESPLEHDFFFNMKWWNEVSSGMKHECNEIFNESWSETDAGEKDSPWSWVVNQTSRLLGQGRQTRRTRVQVEDLSAVENSKE